MSKYFYSSMYLCRSCPGRCISEYGVFCHSGQLQPPDHQCPGCQGYLPFSQCPGCQGYLPLSQCPCQLASCTEISKSERFELYSNTKETYELMSLKKAESVSRFSTRSINEMSYIGIRIFFILLNFYYI